jgi:hypothetical protein
MALKIAPIKILSMPIRKSMETHRIVRPKTRQKSYLRRSPKLIEKMGGMGGMTTTGTGAGVVTIGMGSYPKKRKKRKTR